jgi:hypothetical protein
MCGLPSALISFDIRLGSFASSLSCLLPCQLSTEPVHVASLRGDRIPLEAAVEVTPRRRAVQGRLETAANSRRHRPELNCAMRQVSPAFRTSKLVATSYCFSMTSPSALPALTQPSQAIATAQHKANHASPKACPCRHLRMPSPTAFESRDDNKCRPSEKGLLRKMPLSRMPWRR